MIVWTLTLVAFAWWSMPHMPRGLAPVVQAFYTPYVMSPVFAGATLLLAWKHRDRLWEVLGASVLVTMVYLSMLT